ALTTPARRQDGLDQRPGHRGRRAIVGVGHLDEPHHHRIAPEVDDAVPARSQVPLEVRAFLRIELPGEGVGEDVNELAAGELLRSPYHAGPTLAGGNSSRTPSPRAAGLSVTQAKSFAKQRSSVQSSATRTFFSSRGSLPR